MSKDTPLVSVIIVNYNGKQFMQECFDSLFKIEFPKSQYEVIMVDNASKDLSLDFVEKHFPQIKVIISSKNLGFAGGVNLGVREAKGKYIVLLNNDTRVDKNWLKELVKRIESDSSIAAVNSKVYLYYPFIELTIKSDIHLRSEFSNTINFQSVGVMIENIVLEDHKLEPLIRYKSGFYGKEDGVIPARWTKGDASILVPIDPHKADSFLNITIRAEKSTSTLQTGVIVKCGNQELISDNLKSHQVKQFKIDLKHTQIKRDFLYVVQNAGVVLFKSGYGRDRGAVVKDTYQFYELDNEFYRRPAEIEAFSGASVIIRKKIFEDLDGFDELYFMYYEDVDLSLRMRRKGYKIMFEPKSQIYHIHSGSSGENSTFFLYNVEKNHLATLIKHYPWNKIVFTFARFLIIWLILIVKMCKWKLREHWEIFDYWKEKTTYRYAVIKWVAGNFLPLLIKRYKLIANDKVSMKKIYKNLH